MTAATNILDGLTIGSWSITMEFTLLLSTVMDFALLLLQTDWNSSSIGLHGPFKVTGICQYPKLKAKAGLKL